ncbi:hypothetical protein AVEN_30480-1 [Araneus ventricosus]|uniref:Uncharacterized protein n=1 Tax=Araneus ventricosus TaxID=182803 RepID=A0A4Y2UCR9_ARAVE|nr:hypothetical protein AVEN_30480-1 [Araneus ventricosus]
MARLGRNYSWFPRDGLHVQSVTMTGHIYQDVILELNMYVCFRGAMGAEFHLWMTAPVTHRANIGQIPPSIRRISPVWISSILTGRINRACVGYVLADQDCNPSTPPTCLRNRRALLDDWCNIPKNQIDNLILSMPRRCKACIASSRDILPY